MSFEEEFDKIMRDKVDEAAFPFDEANWTKMGRQLDQVKKPAGFFTGKKVFVAGAFLLLLSSALLITWNIKGDNNTSLTIATEPTALQNEPASENTIPAPQTHDQTELNNTDQSKIDNTETPGLNTSGKTKSTPPEKENLASADKSLEVPGYKSPDATDKKSNEVNENFTNNNYTKARTDVAMKRSPKSVQSSAGNTNVVSDSGNDKKSNAKMPPAYTPVAPKDAVVEPAPASMANTSPESSKVIEKETVQPVVSVPVNEATVASEKEEAMFLSTLITALPTSAGETEIIPIAIVPFKYFDEDYYKKNKNKTHYLNVEAGAAYLFGWDVKNGSDAKGFNWFGGLNYGLYLSRKTSVSLGAQIYNIAHIEQPFYTHTKTEYGFSSVRSNTIITSQALYYASVPIKLTYAISSQSQFGLGLNVGMLMNAKNKVETFTLSELGKTDAGVVNRNGIYAGMSTTNMMVSMFYKTQIAKHLSVNGEFVYGLTDIFENTKNTKYNENAVGLRLSLQYILFDK